MLLSSIPTFGRQLRPTNGPRTTERRARRARHIAARERRHTQRAISLLGHGSNLARLCGAEIPGGFESKGVERIRKGSLIHSGGGESDCKRALFDHFFFYFFLFFGLGSCKRSKESLSSRHAEFYGLRGNVHRGLAVSGYRH